MAHRQAVGLQPHRWKFFKTAQQRGSLYDNRLGICPGERPGNLALDFPCTCLVQLLANPVVVTVVVSVSMGAGAVRPVDRKRRNVLGDTL